MPPPYRLIGLTGGNGSGKGEAAAWLRGRSYAYLSLSDVIREELRRDGIAETRDALIARGNALRRTFGADVLARRVLAQVTGPTVIDSIRNPAEVAALRREEGFVLLAFDAPAAVRFERAVRRGRDESAPDLGAFIRKEAEERSADPSAQQLDACMALADIRIENGGTIEDLHHRLEELI
jgi:dCMP deaminase